MTRGPSLCQPVEREDFPRVYGSWSTTTVVVNVGSENAGISTPFRAWWMHSSPPGPSDGETETDCTFPSDENVTFAWIGGEPAGMHDRAPTMTVPLNATR